MHFIAWNAETRFQQLFHPSHIRYSERPTRYVAGIIKVLRACLKMFSFPKMAGMLCSKNTRLTKISNTTLPFFQTSGQPNRNIHTWYQTADIGRFFSLERRNIFQTFATVSHVCHIRRTNSNLLWVIIFGAEIYFWDFVIDQITSPRVYLKVWMNDRVTCHGSKSVTEKQRSDVNWLLILASRTL